ncbi:nonribosomal peptide synthetase fmqC [Aspergillus clavatus NRRL 1]|uniref:Nonribosomal peptide synthase, putative n=1 Tax=Aspergillus clavatus (strain ATCC 1007 / CBS 513.65 / DSM 816 / NCTC 3887 / NRRL 1 / QM 1276 / 107) TaxID=344612 RepID=A1CN66_ASPCL|nr:nonribosomal peptide synthase, putative [Aspergillus clavatus NRRL 1]EAW07087.1 nonribosomal peptide synthase, putative [Aspergillus clavatus NRRL 1]
MFEPRPLTSDSDKVAADVSTTVTEIPLEDTLPQRFVPQNTWMKATPHPVERTVGEVFQSHVLERPDALAVCACDGTYTYRELDKLSTAMAHELRRQGVTAEVLVALLFEKSKFIVVAMHAVLKAGGAIMFWDPSLPVDRLRGIFAESGAQMVLSSSTTAGMAAQISSHTIIVDEEHIPAPSSEALVTTHRPNSALYSVFTSGSTGKPKGFIMEHRALVTCALACGQQLGITKESRTLQFSSNSFDLATFEHLIPFVFGACICIPSEEERKGDLTRALDKYQVSLAMMTPSVSRLLEPQHLPLLRTVMLCGEPVSVDDVRRWSAHVHLHNGYSPAEAGCINILNSAMTEAHPNNIGFSTGVIPWVVDPDNHDRLLPVGEVGELIIQGHAVGRGYFGSPERNKASFIDAPAWVGDFGRESYGSFYKTGDLVRYEPSDGSMQFLGRKDTQVKLHGQRLELGEVEDQLRRHFAPPHAVIVDLVTPKNREPNLIAFVSRSQDMTVAANDALQEDHFLVPDEQFVIAAREAQAALRAVLPSYMVPSEFFLLSHLVMLPSGKTDRRSIRTAAADLAPTARRKYSSMLESAQDRPATDLEELVLALWATSLNMPAAEIGVRDNFFNLGGSSLDALRLAASARKMGYSDLPSGVVFKYPTVRSMAGVLEGTNQQRSIASQPAESVQLEPSLVAQLLSKARIQTDELEHPGFLPMTAFQRKSAGLKCMHIVLDISGVDHSRLQAAWGLVQERHISLRSVYIPHLDHVYQGFLRRANLMIPIQECDQPAQDFATAFCDKDAEPVLDGRPWWQLTRINSTQDGSSALIIRTTHAQFDAMTLGVIFNDFMAAMENGQLSARERQFSDYMTRRVQHNSSQATVEFWSKFLQGSQMSQPVFTDASAASLPDDHIGMVYVMRPIQSVSTPPTGITMASAFRAAWAFVLANYTGQHDLVFGEFIEGRTLPLLEDVENITGCTAAETPMRILIPQHAGATVQDLLSHSQEQYIARLPYETSELPDLVPLCAPLWPKQTSQFSHLLVVENTSAIPPVTVDGRVLEHRWAFHGRLEDVQIQLVPMKDSLHVAILGPEIRLTNGIADMLVGRLASTLNQFIEKPDALLAEIQWE